MAKYTQRTETITRHIIGVQAAAIAFRKDQFRDLEAIRGDKRYSPEYRAQLERETQARYRTEALTTARDAYTTAVRAREAVKADIARGWQMATPFTAWNELTARTAELTARLANPRLGDRVAEVARLRQHYITTGDTIGARALRTAAAPLLAEAVKAEGPPALTTRGAWEAGDDGDRPAGKLARLLLRDEEAERPAEVKAREEELVGINHQLSQLALALSNLANNMGLASTSGFIDAQARVDSWRPDQGDFPIEEVSTLAESFAREERAEATAAAS